MQYRVESIGREVCHRGFLRLVRYRLRHSLFAGGWSPILVRERLEGLRAAAVLLYDPVRDRVVLVEQFRVGLFDEGPGAWALEPVGGVIETAMDAETTARREAVEEAGCPIGELEEIGCVAVSPGFSDDRVWLFCGRVDSAGLGGVHGLAHEGEDIRVVVLEAEQAFAELFSGRLSASTAIITIQWLAANRERLRGLWGPD